MDYQLDENYEVSQDSIMGTKIRHPAFGTFRINRSSCGEHPLFGSSLMHRDVMTLTVSHASMNRELHNDWVHAERPIVKFEMSYSQFMEAFCNLTSGTGIPCTINFTEKDGQIPECKYISKEEEFQDEFQKKLMKSMPLPIRYTTKSKKYSQPKSLYPKQTVIQFYKKSIQLSTVFHLQQNLLNPNSRNKWKNQLPKPVEKLKISFKIKSMPLHLVLYKKT